MPKSPKNLPANTAPNYDMVLADVAALLETARRAAVRSVNSVMTAAYWQIGRRLVEVEQAGQEKAEYGEQLMERLSKDLTARFGRGFGRSNLFQMRQFYLTWPIVQTLSGQLADALEKTQTLSAKSETVSRKLPEDAFPLSWSHYVRLLSVRTDEARRFYETEALRGGWSLRQLDRQIGSQFYERTALFKNKATMLTSGMDAQILAAEYRLVLPDPAELEAELARTRRLLEGRP